MTTASVLIITNTHATIELYSVSWQTKTYCSGSVSVQRSLIEWHCMEPRAQRHTVSQSHSTRIYRLHSPTSGHLRCSNESIHPDTCDYLYATTDNNREAQQPQQHQHIVSGGRLWLCNSGGEYILESE